MNTESQLEKAISLIRNGDTERGGLLLINHLRHDPQSETGWLWMTNVVVDLDLRLDCLDKALKINPNNKHALAMHAKLATHRAARSQQRQVLAEDQQSNVFTTHDAEVATILAGTDSDGQFSQSPPQIQSQSKPEHFGDREPNSSDVALSPRLIIANTSEQNLKLALLGGLLGMLLGGGIWGAISLLTGLQLGYVVLIVGLITGITTRIMGQGQHIRFGFIGASLTIVGSMLGAYIYFVPESGTLGPAVILPKLGAIFDIPTLLLWLLTILVAFWLSFAHTTTSTYAVRPSGRAK